MGKNHKYGARNVVIEKKTQVILSAAPLCFACVDLDSDKSIGSLKRVAPNQTVTIKGKVVNLSGRKKIAGKNLSKQEGMIVDSNDTMKVVLWESFIDSVEEGKTYEFINFTYKVDKYGIYIGSGRNESSVKEVEGLEGPLAESGPYLGFFIWGGKLHTIIFSGGVSRIQTGSKVGVFAPPPPDKHIRSVPIPLVYS